MSRKLINQGAGVGGKIMGGLLFLSVLAGCGKKPNTLTPPKETPTGVNTAAYMNAVEKIGGWGACDGGCLLKEAATESRQGQTKTNTFFTRNGESTQTNGYKLVEKIDNKPLISVLTSREVLNETKKSQLSFGKPKKDLILKDGITGTYKKFVEAILADDPNNEKTRHAKLFILAEGLGFLHQMANVLKAYDDAAVNQVKTGFEAKIAQAVAGVHAIVNENESVWPPIEFLTDDTEINSIDGNTIKKQKKTYVLPTKSKEAAETLIKEVEAIVEEFKREKDAK